MTDTHTHLYLPEFDGEEHGAVDRAFAAGVKHMIFPNVNAWTITPMLELAADYPGKVFMAMGLHPSDVKSDGREQLAAVRKVFEAGSWVAVGEVGIDLYWDKTHRTEQKIVLAEQLRWAHESDLPVILHCREGLTDMLEVLKAHKGQFGTLPEVVFHSFTGTVDDVRRIREVTDAMFGINGVVTFKNAATLREALPEIGIERILLETDSPYLAPVPHRGTRNESAYVVNICSKVSEVLDISVDEAEALTDANAKRFFSLPD